MTNPAYRIERAADPLVAVALHDGHALRPNVADLIALSEAERLREEDPFTGNWTVVAGNRVVVDRSRFEVDLNRPREKAVYLRPEDAWGLRVWRDDPGEELVRESLRQYDAFYDAMKGLLAEVSSRFGRVVVLDLHSYNHRRDGPEGAAASPDGNPEVNLGTGSLERARWAPIVDGFIRDLERHDFLGRGLDVRENVKFQGGFFSRWIHKTFPSSACCLAIEFKKFFMNEWTGEVELDQSRAIEAALRAASEGLRAQLAKQA